MRFCLCYSTFQQWKNYYLPLALFYHAFISFNYKSVISKLDVNALRKVRFAHLSRTDDNTITLYVWRIILISMSTNLFGSQRRIESQWRSLGSSQVLSAASFCKIMSSQKDETTALHLLLPTITRITQTTLIYTNT